MQLLTNEKFYFSSVKKQSVKRKRNSLPCIQENGIPRWEPTDEEIESGIFAYQNTRRGITQTRKFSVTSQNSLCTLKTGRCKYRNYKEKELLEQEQKARSNSAKTKTNSNTDDDSDSDLELEEVDYEENERRQLEYLQQNLLRVEAILRDLSTNIDGEEMTS